MKKIKIAIRNLINNNSFWIGFFVCFIINEIDAFIDGREDLKSTLFWGILSIIIIGFRKMDDEINKNLKD
ncbi:hypothetical protein [Heyndrickxia camelliae]|uniref:Uncharacterized protein n=1 Tax=Heyndrickxia camelliae TaxID=1707093 RepID=A0A2N3LCM5_9BACI|nr:hypothetical protein [Heyndrickxia camelliae]PKR82410.1 hypothetical protein CWO92_24650 [Heyndrickxia camelliae]